MTAASASFLFEQKIKPDVLKERIPLRSTRNTRPPLPERMLEIEAKKPNQTPLQEPDQDIIRSKISPDK